MKPLAFNLRDAKKIASDKHTSTFQLGSGHEIKILHSAIPALQRKQIEKMPLCSGGEVLPKHMHPPKDPKLVAVPRLAMAEGGDAQVINLSSPDTRPIPQAAKDDAAKAKTKEADEKERYGQTLMQRVPKGTETMKAGQVQEFAKGGNVSHEKGINKNTSEKGVSEAGHLHDLWIEDPEDKHSAKDKHHEVLQEMRKINPKLQGLAEGGNIKMYADSEEPVSAQDSAPVAAQALAPAAQTPAAPTPPIEPTTELANTQGLAPAQEAPPKINLLNPNGTANTPAAVTTEIEAARQQAALDAQKAASTATMEDAYSKQKAVLAQRDMNNYQELKKHTDEFNDWMVQNPVNANHYVENMKTANKVGTAMALFLGGVGQGAVGGNNPALDFLNNQINRDLDAQKATVDQRKSVYGAYRDLYGEGNIANNLAKVSLLDIYDHKMKNMAAQIGTKQAAINYQSFAAKKAAEQRDLLLKSTNDAAIPRMGGTHTESMVPAGSPSAPGTMPGPGAAPTSGMGSGRPGASNHSKPAGKNAKSDDGHSDHILLPGVNEAFQRAHLDPRFDSDRDEVQKQLDAASVADKAIDAINEHIPAMSKNINEGEYLPESGNIFQGIGATAANTLRQIPGYLHKKGEQFEDVPFIGKAIAGASNFATDTQSNREYDAHRDAVLSAISSALVKGGMTPTDAHSAAMNYMPIEGDTPKMIQEKMRLAKEKIRNVGSFNALERHFMTRPAKK